MAESKKARMKSYWEDNPTATSTEVAEEFDTNPAYARRCKPSDLRGNTQQSPARDLRTDGADSASELADSELSSESEPDSENPLSELVIEDTHDSYVCSDCEREVEYLADECGNCGESLVWARGVEA
jgi:hypothetical protein